MRAFFLHGVFVVWRHGTNKETIYDWGVYQLDDAGKLDAHLLSYKPEIICEARVPVYTSRIRTRSCSATSTPPSRC